MTSTGKFVYMAHHLILPQLNPFGLRVDSEGWWFEHFMSQFQVDLLAEGAKNVSLPWLSPLQGWSSLTMTSTSKFVYMSHHLILQQLNPFELMVDTEPWWFENSLSKLRVAFSAGGAKNVSSPWLSPLRGWVSLTMTSAGKLLYLGHHFILLRLNPFGLWVDSEGWCFEHSMP